MKPFSEICTGCSLCCRMVSLNPDFTEPIDENGVCVHLKDNKCSIYEDRPLLCRVDEMYEELKDNFASKEDYIKTTIKVCNSLISEIGLDDKYLIKEI